MFSTNKALPEAENSNMKKSIFYIILVSLVFFTTNTSWAQTADTIPVFDYTTPKDYEVGGIKVTGANFSDENAIIAIAGFKVGDKVRIPGGQIPRAIKALWRLRLFTDVQIYQEKTIGDIIFLEIAVKERPQLSRHSFKGVKKSTHDDLNDVVNQHLIKGAIVTETVKNDAIVGIKDYFKGKGYTDVKVKIKEIDDKGVNKVRLVFDIDRKDRIKIHDITFNGNENVKSSKLRGKMENTRRKRRLFASSKLIKPEYKADKEAIIAYYNTLGFRDAIITLSLIHI